MKSLSVGSFDEAVAARMRAQTTTLASRWLERLTALLPVDPNDVFPGERLLDHIPAVVAEIAGYLVAPEAEEIAANTAVIDKARQLGLLRYEQQASLHQLLREYELLAEVLENFVAEETHPARPAAGVRGPAGGATGRSCGARPDARDGRNLRRRIHQDAERAAAKAGKLSQHGQPRAAQSDWRADVRRPSAGVARSGRPIRLERPGRSTPSSATPNVWSCSSTTCSA